MYDVAAEVMTAEPRRRIARACDPFNLPPRRYLTERECDANGERRGGRIEKSGKNENELQNNRT